MDEAKNRRDPHADQQRPGFDNAAEAF